MPARSLILRLFTWGFLVRVQAYMEQGNVPSYLRYLAFCEFQVLTRGATPLQGFGVVTPPLQLPNPLDLSKDGDLRLLLNIFDAKLQRYQWVIASPHQNAPLPPYALLQHV